VCGACRLLGATLAVAAAACGEPAALRPQEVSVRVERLLDAPIVTPDTHPSLGSNIQGPSLIRVPDWAEAPLGRYYLYFADHKGSYIRLAHADALTGPWTVHPPGSLQLAESHFPTEPPDAPWWKVQRLRLEDFALQVTRVATSTDGIHFQARPEVLGKTYLRAFRHDGQTYALAMPGQLYRSKDGLGGFEEGPLLFNEDMRHAALLERGRQLHVFWTQVGHAPERILLSTIDLSGPWEGWRESEAIEVLRPERPWEGADAALEPSIRSVAYGHVNQLRDPAIFEEEGRVSLLYAVAGESGIAIAELHLE
jgi:hypothetical protein